MFPDPVIVKADGRDIAVEDAGPGSGFPIIMMNGSGSRHLFRRTPRWRAQMALSAMAQSLGTGTDNLGTDG
jgi:hypothetical protein